MEGREGTVLDGNVLRKWDQRPVCLPVGGGFCSVHEEEIDGGVVTDGSIFGIGPSFWCYIRELLQRPRCILPSMEDWGLCYAVWCRAGLYRCCRILRNLGAVHGEAEG